MCVRDKVLNQAQRDCNFPKLQQRECNFPKLHETHGLRKVRVPVQFFAIFDLD